MSPSQMYLFAYNFIQVFGWSIVLMRTVCGLADGLSWPELYESVKIPLNIFQTAAVLEVGTMFVFLAWLTLHKTSQRLGDGMANTATLVLVLHSMFGLVRSPMGTTLMQVTSRVMLIWPILHMSVTSRSSIGVPLLLIAWSVTEVIRYSFYGLGLINSVPFVLTWLRYTTFIVLYPMGVTGELLTLFSALPEIAEKKPLTLEMPNALNMGISFYWVLILASISYIPGFPQLYFYMFGQRKKVLGTEPAKKKI